MEYYGTTLVNGQPINQTCVADFDNSAFLMGQSLTAINLCKRILFVMLMIRYTNMASFWLAITGWAEVLTNGTVGQFAKRAIPYPADEDRREQVRVADSSRASVAALPLYVEALNAQTPQDILYAQVPNPFLGVTGSSTADGVSNQTNLYITDASEGGQVSGLPKLSPHRV